MHTKTIKQEVILPCFPQEAYEAWLDSKTHSEIIGANAVIDPSVGGNFSLWDGEMTGKTITIDKNNLKIEQEWRDNGSNWPEKYFSVITLTFVPNENNNTKLFFTQTGIPKENTNDLENGWENFYWKPMKEYFKSKKNISNS